MIIVVVNRTRKRNDRLRRVLRAVNRQIERDFEPWWGFGATLCLERTKKSKPDKGCTPARAPRADAYLYLTKKTDCKDAQGFHDLTRKGMPAGYVVSDSKIDPHWSITLSHEVLELIGDPFFNLLVEGPDPHDRRHKVMHWFEMCDAVQEESYHVGKVRVSNFVLPRYFMISKEATGPCDFLGRAHKGVTLQPFGTNPGGYINYFDPHDSRNVEYWHPGNARAKKRRQKKKRIGVSRPTRRRGT